MYENVSMQLMYIRNKLYERCIDIRHPLNKACEATTRDSVFEIYFWCGAVCNVLMNLIAQNQLGAKDGAPMVDVLMKQLEIISIDKPKGGG